MNEALPRGDPPGLIELPLRGVVLNNGEDRDTPPGKRFWKLLCVLLIVSTLGALTIEAVFNREFASNISDGVVYLDISDAVLSGNWGVLLNAYWSPAYPVVLSIGRVILHPSPELELATIYGIQWAIGIAAFACLVYFVMGLPGPDDAPGVFRLTRPMLLAAACVLFVVAAQTSVPIYLLTPDLLLGAFLWLGGGVFLRIARGQRLYHYGLLAVAVVLGYFTKAAAVSLAFAALAILPFTGADRKKALQGTLLYALTATLLIAPYVVKLSAAKGHFTFGESGGLNYAWIVDGADSVIRWFMQNDTPHGHARMNLAHPAQRVLLTPDVYLFPTPLNTSFPPGGSFPRLDDPSYWDEGLKPAFYLKGQIWHLAMNVYHSLTWLAERGEFVVGLVLLFWVQRRFGIPARLRETLPVFLWFAGLWGLYLLVDVEDRYVFALLTALLLLAAASLSVPDSPHWRGIISIYVMLIVLGGAIRHVNVDGSLFYKSIKERLIGRASELPFGPFDNPYWKDAQTLTGRLGLRPGDSVACLDVACDNTYWARLAGVRVTAELSKYHDYWESTPAERANAISVLAAAGVKAVVAHHLGPGSESESWIPLSPPQEDPPQDLFARLTR